MTGVSVQQWRDNIGRFNISKIRSRTFINACKPFIIFPHFKSHLNVLQLHLLFILSLIHSILLLFGFSSMVVIMRPFFLLVRILLWFILFPDSTFSQSDLSLTVFLVLSFPKGISLLNRKIISTGNFLMNNYAFLLFISEMLLIMAGIESNPGPSSKNLSFAVWNLDSLPARDYARLPLIESFQAAYNFDIFGICESALSDDTSNDSILIDGFSPDPIRADKADDTRNGGVCLYFRQDLPIKSRTDLASIPETIVAEIKLNRKKNILCSIIPPS